MTDLKGEEATNIAKASLRMAYEKVLIFLTVQMLTAMALQKYF